jgi:hypothetical protein
MGWVTSVSTAGHKKLRHPMKIEDFSKDEALEHECPSWTCTQTVPTVLGEFSVRLIVGDKGSIDMEMVQLAAGAADFLTTKIDSVVAIVLADHKRATEDPSNLDFEDYEIPRIVSSPTVGKYLSGRKIEVFRDCDNPACPHIVEICVTPEWELEHGLRLNLSKGEILSVNESPFRIEEGKLHYE